MKIDIITAFPNFFTGPLNESILGRAQQKNMLQIDVCDLRDFAADKHRQVDDYPYGGGPGMVLKAEPFFKAVDHLKRTRNLASPRIVLMTPQGKTYNQAMARELKDESELVFLCGHYKGVDERVREYLATDEISIGDYVLTGGELAAMVVIDSVVRLIPGVINDIGSADTDSFENGHLDCPYYTRPKNLNGMVVPEVLLSGNHQEIARWRETKALQLTRERRGDLLLKSAET